MPLDGIGSSARQELSRLNSEIASATADRDEAQRQVNRLERPTALLAEAVQEHAAEKVAHDAAVVVWYQGGAIGSRPAPSPAMLELERRIGELHQDVGASGDALKSAQTALDAQNAHLGQLALARQSALYRSAAEAAGAFLETECKPAMIASLAKLAVIESLAAELRRLGTREPAAMSVSRDLDKMLMATRQSVAVRGDLQSAVDFLDALSRDPAAVLSVPQTFEAVELPDRSVKPMEDGTKYLNRGPVEAPPEPVFPTDFGQPEGWAFMPPRGAAA
jgi:hypothetical protein